MFLFGGFWCVVAFSAIQISFGEQLDNGKYNFGKQLTKNKAGSHLADADKLKITIFYESDCPDCVGFFKNQLQPNYKSFSQYMTLDFVPYGNAKQTKDADGNYKFECQHGQKECDENELQACALDKYSNKSSSSLDEFIMCYMAADDKSSIVKECAKQCNIDLKKLKSCTKSQVGNILLAKMGNRTHEFRPEVKWVPTIVFNDVGNDGDSERATKNLKQVICEKLDYIPKCCHGMSSLKRQ